MKNITLWLFSITGLTFWFLAGFPFGHYHESYEWLAQYYSNPATELILGPVGHYAGLRPLGQISAILMQWSFKNIVVPVQLINICITVFSFLIVINHTQSKKLFALLAFLCGGFLFLAFAYLFRFHGLFYSPLLLLLASLYVISEKEISLQNMYSGFLIMLTAALFYPFACIVYLFFAAGYYYERRGMIPGKIKLHGIFNIIFCLTLLFVLVPDQAHYILQDSVLEITGVYNAIENNLFVTFFVLLLTLFTLYTTPFKPALKKTACSLYVILAAFLLLAGQGVITLWFIACLVKLAYHRKWSLFSLLLVSILFPVFTGAVAKNLRFMAVFTGILSTAFQTLPYEKKLPPLKDRFLLSLGAGMIIVVLLIHTGIEIPAISRLIKPLLLEKEKTHQLEGILEWYTHSAYSGMPVSIESPDEKHSTRIPVSQAYLQHYLSAVHSLSYTANSAGTLIILFEDQQLPEYETVFHIDGQYAGSAAVFLKN